MTYNNWSVSSHFHRLTLSLGDSHTFWLGDDVSRCCSRGVAVLSRDPPQVLLDDRRRRRQPVAALPEPLDKLLLAAMKDQLLKMINSSYKEARLNCSQK